MFVMLCHTNNNQRIKKLFTKTAVQQVYEVMKACTESTEREQIIPEIVSRSGASVSDESILVRISNLKLAFPGWNFYTRTCQQTNKKIIGARPAKEVC